MSFDSRLKWIASEDLKYSQESPNTVSRRARRILNLLRGHVNNNPVTQIQCERIIRGMRKIITSRRACYTICNELRAVTGCVLSPADTVLLACSLSGAVHTAKAQSVVGIWTADVDPQDCLAKITAVKLAEETVRDRPLIMRMLICNSVFAGCEVTAEIRYDAIRKWARMIGLYGPRFKPLAWHTYAQYLDACFVLRVAKRGGMLTVEGASIVDPLKTMNRKLAMSRSRKHQACHFGAAYDCGVCGVGRNQCPKSVSVVDTHYNFNSEEQ